MDSGHIAYVRQHQALGLGHAVWCARRLVGARPVAVILPDDLIVGPVGCLRQMVDAHDKMGGSLVAVMEVPPERTLAYGILDVEKDQGRIVRPRGFVEKPSPGTAPSNLAAIGRYILSPQVMAHLNKKTVGAGGEIQLTDAIAAELLARPGSVHGFRFAGTRFDCGTKAGFLQATVHLALQRDDLRDEFADYLQVVAGSPATGGQARERPALVAAR
jgi:UTP--glucose-1-phosphate uridylyltransferase